ncbi:MAG TPA: signal peptidase I [Chloroflexota bacterium]|nr:signal peptidase I [Chloroflexota bacterium]
MTDMQQHADLQSEVRGTQHALVALLQERLATETNLKAARAELEHVTRVLEQARSEQTRQAVEFDSVVQAAIAEGKALAAEIEALVRRRGAEIEHQPGGALNARLNARLSAAPVAEPVELSPPPDLRPPAPPAAPAASTLSPPTPHLAPPAVSSIPQSVLSLDSPAVSSAREPAGQLVSPAAASAPGRVPQPVVRAASGAATRLPPALSMPPPSVAAPARLSVAWRSLREQATTLIRQLTAHRQTPVLGRLRVHRPGVRQTANLFIGCILALLAILLTPVSQVVGGLQLLAVMSGSMEPTIQVGGIVGVRPVAATDLQVGDVITFATQASPDVLVTHRIVALETRDGQMMVTTKGDANNTIDAMAAPADHAVGRVDFSLPWLGYLMVWLASPVAKVLILVVTVISFALPSVKRAPAAQPGDASESPATSYTALEDEIQALLSPQP